MQKESKAKICASRGYLGDIAQRHEKRETFDNAAGFANPTHINWALFKDRDQKPVTLKQKQVGLIHQKRNLTQSPSEDSNNSQRHTYRTLTKQSSDFINPVSRPKQQASGKQGWVVPPPLQIDPERMNFSPAGLVSSLRPKTTKVRGAFFAGDSISSKKSKVNISKNESGISTKMESSQGPSKKGSEYEASSQAQYKPINRSTFTPRKNIKPQLSTLTARTATTRHQKLNKGGPLMKLTGTFGDHNEKGAHNPQDFFLSKVKKEKNYFANPRASEPFLSTQINNYHPAHFNSQLQFPVKPLQGNQAPDVVSPKFQQKSETGALLNNLIMNIGSSNKKKTPRQKASSIDKPR